MSVSQSVSMTPEMNRHLNELACVRARKGKPMSKADLIREAIRLYLDQQADLPGSRRQITKSIEGKMDALAEQSEQDTALMAEHLVMLTQQVEALAGLVVEMHKAMEPIIERVNRSVPPRK